MTTFFRKLRQQANNKVSNYLFYAIGEIILVVIGILIALQINNINDQKKERTNELKYRANLKKDLAFNILEIDKYIVERTQAIESAKSLP